MQVLKRFPRTSNVLIGAGLGLTGDVLCQRLEHNEKFDKLRAFAFTTFSGLYGGIVSLAIYRKYPGISARVLGKQNGMFDSLLDNFLHVPFLYTPVYFMSTSLMQLESFSEFKEKISNNFIDSVLMCWIIWIPAQAINFTFVHARLQVTFMNVLNVMWSVILDHVSDRPTKQVIASDNVVVLSVESLAVK